LPEEAAVGGVMRYQTPGKERCLLSYMTGESTFKTNGRTAHMRLRRPDQSAHHPKHTQLTDHLQLSTV
jgi:hypothetical protein